MKTVLLLSTSSGPGGAERVISLLAAALQRAGLRVIVGLFRPGWLKSECERLGVDTRVLPVSAALHSDWFRACLRLVRRESVDLIHAHEFNAIAYGWIVSRLAFRPFVGTLHGKNYWWERRRRRIALRVIARTATLVAVSADLEEFARQKLGIRPGRIHVIPNGVAPAAPLDASELASCRAELGLEPGALVLGSVGSLYPVKGQRYLLDALPAVLARFPDCVLLLAGRGELETPLREQAHRLGIESHVRFLGMRQDVPRLLAVMDLFVLPSLSEGLSMALLEAMVAQKAVVVTRVGGNPELVEPERTGLLVPPEDSDALAGALIALLGDRDKRHRFGHSAAERALRDFGVDHMVSRYRAAYGPEFG